MKIEAFYLRAKYGVSKFCRLEIRKAILRMAFAEPFPALERIRVSVFFSKMSCSRNIHTVQGGVAA